MKNNILAKTLLTTYNYLETFANAIDKHVEKRAELSFFVTSNCDNTVMDVADKIIELSQRKINYINFKLIIEKYILSLSEEMAELVIERYIDGEEGQKIASKFNMPIRTYYRKIAEAEGKLISFFERKGYSIDRLVRIIEKDPLFFTAYQGVNSSGEIDTQKLQRVL